MIKVYHMTQAARERTPMSWVNIEELTINENTHTLVAILKDEDSLREAFRLTNHITHNWKENKEVRAMVRNPRSTSVGDLMETDEGLFLVDGVGFVKTEWEENPGGCGKDSDTCDSIPPGSCSPDCHGYKEKD